VGELGTPPIARWGRACSRFGIPALMVVLALLLAGSAAGRALPTPVPTTPGNGAVVDTMPAFGWNPVAGAEEYEFQIAADSGFNSPVFGQGKDDFRTKNTRATVVQTAPNGTYWWRVRTIGRTGTLSAWSSPRSFTKNWGAVTTLISPVGGADVVYPTTPLTLKWSPVPGARKYLVYVATDPDLGSLVTINGQAQPVETTATALTPVAQLAQGVYYWAVKPLDAEGNPGTRSAVSSFRWVWPSTTTPRVDDVVSAFELFDPRLSWDRIPGAARYEIEINPSIDFAPGSKVCCTGTTINTSLSPTLVLPDNAYYWRVRAIDMDGNAGVWNCYGLQPDPCRTDLLQTFTKTFDNVPPTSPPSIKNVHMRDNLTDDTLAADQDGDVTDGYQTQVPVISWNPVPGASSYQVDVTPYNGSGCVWSAPGAQQFLSNIALTAWTPLGYGWNLVKPYPDPHPVATELSASLIQGQQYCARVRARSDRAFGQEVYGDYTYLDCSTLHLPPAAACTARPDDHGWAFRWTGYPSGNPCSPSCNSGYLGAGDYQLPVAPDQHVAADGVWTVGETPLLMWRPVAGASSYFVIVARDANFTNIVDYAFTQVPAYAPRGTLGPTTYADEVTRYYWAVLPEAGINGSGIEGDPLAAAPQSFYKQSIPPHRDAPADGGDPIADQPTFQWDPVTGARTYHFQVAQDSSFSNPIEDVTTDSTSYSSNTTYPADSVLYWRVRANDENGVGLTWSTIGTFQKTLRRPDGGGNATQGDGIPTWSWNVVPGAVSYDISADLPDGTHRDITGLRTPAFTPVLMYGTGIFGWRVRAEFPRSPFGLTPGPYSPTYPYTKTIREPSGAHADFNADHVLLSWNPKPGAKRYRVQISGTPDFGGLLVENVLTDNISYAPLLRYLGFRTLDTGHLYWRVAAIDEGNNTGDFTQPQLITRTPRMEITIRGSVKRGKRSMLTIIVSSYETGGGIPRATVRISGAGVRARRVRTDAFGNARVVARPSRRGALLITATKRGYRRASLRLTVR
jgi:hypothetical protein